MAQAVERLPNSSPTQKEKKKIVVADFSYCLRIVSLN
jgi:hypothetical protein